MDDYQFLGIRPTFLDDLPDKLDINTFFRVMNKTNRHLKSHMAHARYEIERFAAEAAQNLASRKSVLILGSGCCNDIPLEMLLNTFESVSFLDIDIRSTKEVINTMPSDFQSKCSLYRGDASGLSPLFVKIKDLADNSADTKDIANEIRIFPANDTISLLRDIGLTNSYDLVISSCVSTQLVTPYLFHVLDIKYLTDEIRDAILSLGRKSALEHCKLLKEATSPDGFAIIATDLFEWGYHKGKPIGIANALPLLPGPLDIKTLLSTFYGTYSEYAILGSSIIFEAAKLLTHVVTRGWEWEIQNTPTTMRKYLVVGGLFRQS